MRVHALARCGWCGQPFVWSTVKGSEVWLCPTEACWTRQLTNHVSVTLKGGQDKCLYVPLPRQVEFLESTAKWVLFGGAAGGSKSHALRWKAWIFALRVPEARVLILRRTFKDLERTHMRDAEREAPLFGATFLPSQKLVRLPNQSLVEFGHCEDKAAATNYLSAEYDLILFDELVTFERDMVLLIGSRARTSKPGILPRVLAGTNPGGPQSAWVRAFFIDHTADPAEFPFYKPDDWVYIPSKLEDNPYLNEDYEQSLLSLPPELRKAYRDGDWDIFPGQFFPEWRKARHVTDTHLDYPRDYARTLCMDYGYIKPGYVGRMVHLPEGGAYIEDEYVPVRVPPFEQGAEVAARLKAAGIRRVLYLVYDNQMHTPNDDTGEPIIETFLRGLRSGGVSVGARPADKDRINGWARLRAWLRDDPTGTPWLKVSPHCRYLARTLPSMISADHNPEDLDSDLEDHACDAIRYWSMSRPSPGSVTTAKAIKPGTYGWWKREASRDQTLGILGRR